jgi:hypothetical protein
VTKEELAAVLDKHRKWARGEAEGECANLRGANLRGAELDSANMVGASLRGADLRGANLRGANLERACLEGSYLRVANLRGANLRGACLEGADLRGANLAGANLEGTAIDPASVAHATADALAEAGLRVDGEYVYGLRTRVSQHVGDTDYSKPGIYSAPVFSVCTNTSCHPGIYLASAQWLDGNGYSGDRVKCRALIADCIVAGDKVRARKIEVLKEEVGK